MKEGILKVSDYRVRIEFSAEAATKNCVKSALWKSNAFREFLRYKRTDVEARREICACEMYEEGAECVRRVVLMPRLLCAVLESCRYQTVDVTHFKELDQIRSSQAPSVRYQISEGKLFPEQTGPGTGVLCWSMYVVGKILLWTHLGRWQLLPRWASQVPVRQWTCTGIHLHLVISSPRDP